MEFALLDAHLLDDPTVGLADAAIVAVIIGVLQAVKTAFPQLPKRFLPLMAMGGGVGFQIAQTLSDNPEDIAYVTVVISGLIVGLAAAGAFSTVTGLIRNGTE